MKKKKVVRKNQTKKRSQNPKKVSEALAIVALLLNILVLPGLGSLIGRKTNEGVWQIVLFVLGIPLAFVIVGIPMLIGAWIWGIVTGVQIVKECERS